MYFNVIFKNNNNEEYSLKFKVYDTDIAIRWFATLKEHILKKNNSAAEPDRMYNFPNDSWTETKIVNEINASIDIINRNEIVIEHRAYEGMPQEQLNLLHHYFETLRGGVLSSGKYFDSADREQQLALELFNILIHRSEHFYMKEKYNISAHFPRITVTFNNLKRVPLQDDDYNFFTFHRKFGEVHINYCEVGKPIYDVFKDNDNVIGDDNIRPLRWYSPDFSVHFYNKSSYSVARFVQHLSKWWDKNVEQLADLGFIKGDPKNALGSIPVAMLETNLDPNTIVNELSKYNLIDRVELIN